MGTKSKYGAGTTRGASGTSAARAPGETHEARETLDMHRSFGAPSRLDGSGADAHGTVGVQDAYAPRAFVEEGAVETVHQANATFLALVARRANAPDSAFGVAPPIVQRLAALDPNARRRAAQCPYTLFDLRFADAPFWRETAQDAVAHLADERAAADAPVTAHVGSIPARPVLEIAGGDAHVAVFALKAVFLAWHLARNPDGMAVVALGMTPDVVETWRGLPLSAFDRYAGAALPFLTARWGGHARFWPRLLDAAEHAGGDHAERVRLLGLQLLATETCRGYLPKRPRKPPGA
jgi:hypothetical protein